MAEIRKKIKLIKKGRPPKKPRGVFGKQKELELKQKEERRKKAQKKVDDKLSKGKNAVDPNYLEFPNQKPDRDLSGALTLKPSEITELGLDEPTQHIRTKMKTTVYQTKNLDSVVDNMVRELLPDRTPDPKDKTIPERITDMFQEYELLRDYMDTTEAEKSHHYLVDVSDTYLPKPDVMVKYDGDLVDEEGIVRLKSGNIIEGKDTIFLDEMVGGKITVYAVEPRKDAILDVDKIVREITREIVRINNRDFDKDNNFPVKEWRQKCKQKLARHFKGGQIRRSQLDDVLKLLKELFDDSSEGMEIPSEKKEKQMANARKRRRMKRKKRMKRKGKLSLFGKNARLRAGKRTANDIRYLWKGRRKRQFRNKDRNNK
tara:strand:- start:100 stop:1218 length:1119 start_codon:yes stop_codon:yes gene_type:complete